LKGWKSSLICSASAQAGVGDGDLDGIAGHRLAMWISSVVAFVLDGVGQQVDEDLLTRVARHAAPRRRRQILGDLDARAACVCLDHGDGGCQQRVRSSARCSSANCPDSMRDRSARR